MSRLDDSSRGRVRRVLAAAKKFELAMDPLGAELRLRLSRTSGLSDQGISRVLRDCLETSAKPIHLDGVLLRTGRAPRCHVVLSANVCTAALRAIALAVATSPLVFVKPSSRDPVLAEALVEGLRKDRLFGEKYGGAIELCDRINPEPGDELHIYGSDKAIAAITSDLPAGVIVRAHGTGFGIAVVPEGARADLAAEWLVDDVIAFDQRGCLSPRIALVEGDGERAETFGRALGDALAKAEEMIPRGPIDEETTREIALYGASMDAVGLFLSGKTHAVGVDLAPRALLLPPAARVVHVAAAKAEDVPRLLEPLRAYVTTVGVVAPPSPLSEVVLSLVPHARRASFGWMQRPPLDGPVDLRTSRAVTPLDSLDSLLARRPLSS